jgi:hypothetical protein
MIASNSVRSSVKEERNGLVVGRKHSGQQETLQDGRSNSRLNAGGDGPQCATCYTVELYPFSYGQLKS